MRARGHKRHTCTHITRRRHQWGRGSLQLRQRVPLMGPRCCSGIPIQWLGAMQVVHLEFSFDWDSSGSGGGFWTPTPTRIHMRVLLYTIALPLTLSASAPRTGSMLATRVPTARAPCRRLPLGGVPRPAWLCHPGRRATRAACRRRGRSLQRRDAHGLHRLLPGVRGAAASFGATATTRGAVTAWPAAVPASATPHAGRAALACSARQQPDIPGFRGVRPLCAQIRMHGHRV